jgi:hypothetical protein
MYSCEMRRGFLLHVVPVVLESTTSIRSGPSVGKFTASPQRVAWELALAKQPATLGLALVDLPPRQQMAPGWELHTVVRASVFIPSSSCTPYKP